MKRVVIIDTSILCCWLAVPGKQTAGPDDDQWDQARVDAELKREQEAGSVLVLPIATLIETGNHISQAPSLRFERASRLAEYLIAATDAKTPWAAFTEQGDLWSSDVLQTLAKEWPPLAAQRMSIGDATIKGVADYYAKAGYDVEIMTGDRGLKSYQPATPLVQPRRRR